MTKQFTFAMRDTNCQESKFVFVERTENGQMSLLHVHVRFNIIIIHFLFFLLLLFYFSY